MNRAAVHNTQSQKDALFKAPKKADSIDAELSVSQADGLVSFRLVL